MPVDRTRSYNRLHLDPDEIISSRRIIGYAPYPGDESDDGDEWDLEESEDDWEGPAVRKEMTRWMNVMDILVKEVKKPDGYDEFGLDCHDLSLENVFVDEKDNVKIVSFIFIYSANFFDRICALVDMYHQLGIYNNTTNLGMRPRTPFPSK